MRQDSKTYTLKKNKTKKKKTLRMSDGRSHHLVNVPDAQQVGVPLQAVAFGLVPRLLLTGEEVTRTLVLSPALLTLGPGCTHKTPHARQSMTRMNVIPILMKTKHKTCSLTGIRLFTSSP